MVRRIAFDEKIEKHLNLIMGELKSVGIKNVTRPMALRVIIEINKEARIKIKRKNNKRRGLIFI